MKSKKNNAYILSHEQDIDLLIKKHNISFNIDPYPLQPNRFSVGMFYTNKAQNYNLIFGSILTDSSLIIDTVGFFSPRKLQTCFGIRSRKPLIVFQFMSKFIGSCLKANREFEIHNDFDYFFISEKDFNQFHKICGLEVLEPPKIILNMESHEKEE